jgi:hypothetical protein
VPDTEMTQGAERFTGTWWLPSEPNRRPGGVLIVQADGQIRLELDGALSLRPRRSHADEQLDYELVRGRVGIRDFTLHKCSEIGRLRQGTAQTRQILLAEIAFDGLRASNVDDLTFDAGVIEIDLLHEWAKWSGAGGRIEWKPYRNDPPGRERFVYNPVPEMTMVANGLKVVLASGISVRTRVGHVEMNTEHMFYIELSQPLPFGEWQTSILRPLQNLVSFVSDQAAWINKLQVSRSARRVGPRGRRHPAPVMVYGDWTRNDKELPGNLTPSSFLVSFDEVASAFDRVLSNWLRVSRDFRDALNLFFGPRYADRMYLESSFLMLAQALEVFHRTKYPATTMVPREEYKKLRNTLIKATPKQYKKLISPLLSRGNDPFLKTRIVELVNYAGPAVTNKVGQPPDRWADDVKNTRNDLTHWNPIRKGIEPGTPDFFDLRRQVLILMKTVLLRELGFSTSECARLLRENWEYGHTRAPAWLKK